jgi:hypothetical protein
MRDIIGLHRIINRRIRNAFSNFMNYLPLLQPPKGMIRMAGTTLKYAVACHVCGGQIKPGDRVIIFSRVEHPPWVMTFYSHPECDSSDGMTIDLDGIR